MGGDSKTTSTSMDPTYAVASTYTTLLGSAMSQELWNMSKPYYQQQLDFSADSMTPYYADLYSNAQSLLPQQTALSGAQLNESLADIERNKPVKDALTNEQLKELSDSSPVREAFYQQALKGVDPDYQQVMGQATGDVEQQYANSEGAIARQLAKTGLSADSGAYTTALAGLNYNKAKDKAFARTNAYTTEKNNVDTENWNRLAQGVSAAGRATGLAGFDSSQTNSSSKNLASSSSTNPYSSSDAYQGTGTALQGIGTAASNFTALGNGNSTKETSGGDSGWGSALGTGTGLIGSAILNNPTVAAAI
uniref:Uncharacterized protein n=1 Tax=Desulfovibrio sp. U5L TaxID=596152 RepID=I2PZY4_9BACT